MTALFAGEPGPLPEVRAYTTRWTVTSFDAPSEEPPRVRHAAGYDDFVALASRYGTDVRSLFDLWAFAHFVRAHREAFDDEELLLAATVFLGNVLVANHPECFWSVAGPELAVMAEVTGPSDGPDARIWPDRFILVGGTVPAILSADEARFLEFGRVVDDWREGAPMPDDTAPPISDDEPDHAD